MKRWHRIIAAGGAALAACGEPPVQVGPLPVALTIVAQDTLTVPNGRLAFSAAATDSQGQPVQVDVTWSVSDTMRGRIDDAGRFVGGPWVGTTHVRVVLAEPALADSVRVRVLAPGTLKWSYEANGGFFTSLNGIALGEDETIFTLMTVRQNVSDLLALTPAGEVRWSTELDAVDENYPVVTPTGDVLVVGRTIHVVAGEGAVRWSLPTAAETPILKGGAATADRAVAAEGFYLAVYDLASGAEIWRSQLAPLSSWLVPPTIVGTDRVLGKRTADTLFVFRLADGTIDRILLDPDTSVDKRVFGVGAVPVGGRYYLPTTQRLAAYDTAGPLLWLTRDTGRGMTEPAVAPDGTLYVQTRIDGLWALNANGSERWSIPEARPRWSWHGGPALAEGGIIYAAGIDAFWAVDTDGNVLWKQTADSAGVRQAFIGAPAIGPDGTVYTFTSTHLYAFWAGAPPEPDSPWPMWRHDAQRSGWAR